MDNQQASNERWYYAQGEAVNGPFSLSELLQKAEEGILNSETLVVPEGSEDWRPFSAIAPADTNSQKVKEAPSQHAEPPPVPHESAGTMPNDNVDKPAPKKLRDKLFEAPVEASAKPAPNNKDALKGCGALVLLIVVAAILWHHWRFLLTMGGFLGVWYGFARSGLQAKRSKVYSVGGGFVLGLLTMMLLRSCVGTDGIDFSNPPAAIEKLAKESLGSAEGFEYIKVEKTGPNQDGYFVNISYRSPGDFIGGEKGSFQRIKRDMNDTYKTILAHPELAVVHLKINAQLELKDKFGNTAWVDVYRTRLEEAATGKLNRQNLNLVDFEEIWDVVFIHPIFWPFDEKQSR